MKKFLGLICIIYSVIIGYVWIFDKLKNFLAPNMQIYLKLSLPLLLIMGIMLLKEKKDKFKISDLILLLPIVMIIFASDGKLSSQIAINRSSKPKVKKVIKKEIKENLLDFFEHKKYWGIYQKFTLSEVETKEENYLFGEEEGQQLRELLREILA